MYTKTHVHTATTATVRVFDKIARKHNVTYFLTGGTLIGGMRRGGIIPWDGDGDIGIVEEDYDRLKFVLQKELPRGMYFLTPCQDHGFSWGVPKPLECDPDYTYKYNVAKIKALCSTYSTYKLYADWGVSNTLVAWEFAVARVVGGRGGGGRVEARDNE